MHLKIKKTKTSFLDNTRMKRKNFLACIISSLEYICSMCPFSAHYEWLKAVTIRDKRQFELASSPSEKRVFYGNEELDFKRRLGKGTDGWVDEYISESGKRVAIKAFKKQSFKDAKAHMRFNLGVLDEYIIPRRYIITEAENPYHIMEVADGTAEDLFFCDYGKKWTKEKHDKLKCLLEQYEDWAVKVLRILIEHDLSIPDWKLGNIAYKKVSDNKVKFFLIDIDSIAPSGKLELVATHSIGSYVGKNEKSQRTATIQSVAMSMLLLSSYICGYKISLDLQKLIYYDPNVTLNERNAKKRFEELQKKRRDCRMFRDIQFFSWKINWYSVMSFQVYGDYNFFHAVGVFINTKQISFMSKKVLDTVVEEPLTKKPRFTIV